MKSIRAEIGTPTGRRRGVVVRSALFILGCGLSLAACGGPGEDASGTEADAPDGDGKAISELTAATKPLWSSHFPCSSGQTTIADGQVQFIQKTSTRQITGYAFSTTKSSFRVQQLVLETFDHDRIKEIDPPHYYTYGGTGSAVNDNATHTAHGNIPFEPQATGQETVQFLLRNLDTWEFCIGTVRI